MTYQPLVSIITPTYNHEKFIGQCIESVLAQTYPRWEQIIIDDGSNDRTGETILQYNDERIRYIRQDNVGIWRLAKTYNKAVTIARGELIAILEGDDYWPPWKLERQIPAFKREEVVLSWGKVFIVNSQHKVIRTSPNTKYFNRFNNTKGRKTLQQLLFHNFIPACTVICRKNALNSIQGFKQPQYAPYVDYPTWLVLSLVGEFYPLNEVLGYHRSHENQVSKVMNLTMTKANRYSIYFFKKLPQQIKDSIGISVDALVINCQFRLASTFFHLGRIDLTVRKWKDARENFRKAFNKGSFKTKVKAMVGILCTFLKINLEWAATILNQPRLQDME